MRKLFIITIITLTASILFACKGKTERTIDDVVDSFATHFLEWRYQECMDYVTPESQRKIILLASNITESDIDAFHKAHKDISYEIKEVKQLNDTVATATVDIKNALMPTTIGVTPEVQPQKQWQIKLKFVNDKWLIDLN